MKKRILGLLCLLALLPACAPKKPDTPAPVPPSSSPPSGTSPESPTAPDPAQTPETPVPPAPSQPIQPSKADPNAISYFDCGTLDLSDPEEIAGRENFEEFLNVTGSGTAASIQITHESEDSTATLTFADGVYTFRVSGKESTWKQLQITESVTSGQIRQTFRLTNTQDLPADTPDGTKAITLFQETIES